MERCLAVRDLVVVCSSSRGGSSVFGELLRRHAELLGFSAELNPHVTIATLGADGGCGLLADPAPVAGTPEGLAVLRGELGWDLGQPDEGIPGTEPETFAMHVAWRLTMQWPDEAIDPDLVAAWVGESLAEIGSFDRHRFLLALLARVRRRHPSVNPLRYDLPATEVRAAFPSAQAPVGPTAEPVVEMAPFVAPRPWRLADPRELGRRTVIATTPRNAFRVPLLCATFPNARVRVLHLTRNPAAAVNGLRDGWLHHGFFSCRSDVPLHIGGYNGPWADSWWNYDVPPGWREWTRRPLLDVCAFQWRAAHLATMQAIEALRLDAHRVAIEDVVGPPDRREPALRALARWLDVDESALLTAGSGTLPVVMRTARPRPGRWRDRAGELLPAVSDPDTLEVAEALGYPPDTSRWN